MSYFTYILFSESRKRYYVGSSHDVVNRISEHNAGDNRSTKSGKPWQTIVIFERDTRSEAAKLEKKIKKRGIKRFLQDNELSGAFG